MNFRYLRAILSVVLVTGVAGASMYVSTKISSSKSVSPNAPSSRPFARFIDENAPTKKPTVASQNPGVGNVPAKNVNKTPTATPYISSYNPQSNPARNPTVTVTTAPPANGKFGHVPQPGEYGYGTDKECGGFVSGYYCVGGERRVVDLVATRNEYYKMVNEKSASLTDMSSAELLSQAKISCTPTKTNNYCKKEIADAQEIVLKNNLIIDKESIATIETARIQNEAINDIANINLTKSDLENKYGLGGDPKKILGQAKVATDRIEATVEVRDKLLKFFDNNIPTAVLLNEVCHGVSSCLSSKNRSDYLASLKLEKDQLNNLNNQFNTGKEIQESLQKNINTYLSTTPDPVLAQNACKDIKELRLNEICENNFKRSDLLEGLEPNSTQYKTLVSEKKDMDLATQYADPKFSNITLANIYCNGQSDKNQCTKTFTRDKYLDKITNQSYKDAAVTNWNTSLSTLIPQVVGKEGPVSVKVGSSVIKLDSETVNKVKNLNQDTQNAFAAYAYINQGKSESTMKTSDQLAEQFNELLKKDPSALNKYLASYKQNPTKYTEIKTGTGKGEFISIYKINPKLEENSLIISNIKTAIKTTDIKGFYEGGKVVPYKVASEEYKNEARKLACEQDKSLFKICDVFTDAKNVNSVKYKESLAELDKKVESGNYLDKLLQIKMDPVNKLSTFGSNLATIDNLSVDKNIRDKALADAEAKRSAELYALRRYGYSMSPEIKKDLQNYTIEEKNSIANEYLNQKLVEETYTRGAGIGGALSVAVLAGTACAPGTLIASIGCGAVAGLAAAASNLFPVLGTVTAEEIAQEQQNIKNFKPSDILDNSIANTILSLPLPINRLEKYLLEKYGDVQPFNNDTTASLVQSIYSNQGAACDTVDGFKIGASCTTKDNQFSLLDGIRTTNQNFGITTDYTSPEYRAQISIQPFLNQEFDALQNENQRQAYINLATAPIMGAISGGIGSGMASLNSTNFLTNLAINQSVSLGNTLIGTAQAQYQFTSTVGFVDTQSEIDLEICQRTYGIGSSDCKKKKDTVEEENTKAAISNMVIAAFSDQAIDKAISLTTRSSNLPKKDTTSLPSSTLEYKNTPNNSDVIDPSSRINNLIANRVSNPISENIVTTPIDNNALNLAMMNSKLSDVELKSVLAKAGHSEETVNTTLKIVRDPQVASELNTLNQSFDSQNNDLLLQRNELLAQRDQTQENQVQENLIKDIDDLIFKLTKNDANAIAAIRDRAIEKFSPKVSPIEIESEFTVTLALSDNTKEAIDILKQNKTLSDNELTAKLTEQKFSQEAIDTVLSIRADESFTNFLNQQGQGEYIALTDRINLEAQRLGLTPSQYLEALENLHTVPNDSQDLVAYVRSELNQSPTNPKPALAGNVLNDPLNTLYTAENQNLPFTLTKDGVAGSKTIGVTANQEIGIRTLGKTGARNQSASDKQFYTVKANDFEALTPGETQIFDPKTKFVYEVNLNENNEIELVHAYTLFENPDGIITMEAVKNPVIALIKTLPAPDPITPLPPIPPRLALEKGTQDPAVIFGIEQERLTQITNDLTPQQNKILGQSLIRFADESIKVSSVNSDGSVTYKTNKASDFGNYTSTFKIDSNLPDTNLIQRAKLEGIPTENRSIRIIQRDLNAKLNSPDYRAPSSSNNPIGKILERFFSFFRNNKINSFDHFANTDFSQSHKEILALLPDSDTNTIVTTLNTESGQRSLERINDPALKIIVDPETQKIIYTKELPTTPDKDSQIKIITPSKNSLDVQIIEQAKKLKIDVNGKNIRQVMTEIEKVSAPKLTTGSNELKSHEVNDETTIKGTNMMMERLKEAAVDQIRSHPGSELTQVSFDKYRILTMDQNPKLKGWEKLLEKITDPIQREEVRQQLTRENKAQFLANNQEMLSSAKIATVQDTLISLNKSREEDIASIARFSKSFPDTIKNSIAKVNAEYAKKGIDLKLEYPDGTTAKDFGWWDISADPKEPIVFHFKGNEIIQNIPGGSEIIHGTFLTKLYDKLPTLTDPNLLPIIEQVPNGEINSVNYKLKEKGDFEITGKQLVWKDEYGVEPTPKPKIVPTIEEAKIINKYSFETATTIQDLLSIIPEDQIGNLGVDIMNIKTKGVTTLKANAAVDAAVDIAGFSNITGGIKNITDPNVKATTLDGWGVLLEHYQGDATSLIQAKNGGFTDANGTFHAYEHAGDGIRAISMDNMTVQGLRNLVEVSKSFDNVLARALNGELGPNAQVTAKFIRQEFGNSIFLKVGVKNTDADIHIFPGDRFNSVEITTKEGVDPILDSHKAFKKADKKAGYVVGITKDIYEKFTPTELAKAGIKKIQNEHGYFITEISDSSSLSPLKLLNNFKKNSLKSKKTDLSRSNILKNNAQTGTENIINLLTRKVETKINDSTKIIIPDDKNGLNLGRFDKSIDNPNNIHYIIDTTVHREKINLVRNADGTITATLPDSYPKTKPIVKLNGKPLKAGDKVILKKSSSFALSDNVKLIFNGQDLHIVTSAPNKSGFFSSSSKILELANLKNENNYYYPGDEVINSNNLVSGTIPKAKINGEQVYTRISDRRTFYTTGSYTDLGIYALMDGPNPLPRNSSYQYVIEFGTIDSTGKFNLLDESKYPSLSSGNLVSNQKINHFSPSTIDKIRSLLPARNIKKVPTIKSETWRIIKGTIKLAGTLFVIQQIVNFVNQPNTKITPTITPTPTAIITTTLAPTNTAIPTITYTPTTPPTVTPTTELQAAEGQPGITFYSQYDTKWNNKTFSDGTNFGEDACGFSVTAMILSAYSKDDYGINPYQVMTNYFPKSTGGLDESEHLNLLRDKGFDVTSPNIDINYLNQADPNGSGTLSNIKNSLANGGVLWIGIIDKEEGKDHQALVTMNENKELIVYDPQSNKPVLLKDIYYKEGTVKSVNLILPPSE